MGFPLRSNIFKPGSAEQARFLRFPVHAFILAHPRDRGFADALQDVFLHLHQLTADRVAFFAVLDPPQDWQREARSHFSLPGTPDQPRPAPGLTFDSRPILQELIRLFGVDWATLPCLVASPNLWIGDLVSVECDTDTLPAQLAALTQLAATEGRPTADQIGDTLERASAGPAIIIPGDVERAARVARVYRTLESGPHGVQPNADVFTREVDAALADSRSAFQEARTIAAGLDPDTREQLPFLDNLIAGAAGRLVAPAAAIAYPHPVLDDDLLEEDAADMLATARMLNDVLQRLVVEHAGPRERRSPDRLDFSAASVGVWKATELELNLSLVQAMRAARDIPMPAYHAQHFPQPLPTGSQVRTARRPVELNRPDPHDPTHRRHAFLTFGEARMALTTMRQTEDRLNAELRGCSFDLTDEVLQALERINTIRNQGSHIERLARGASEEAYGLAVHSGLLFSLARLKHCLRSPRPNDSNLGATDTRAA